MKAPTLRGERVLLRAPADADLDCLVEISRAPEVARWWQGWNEEDAREKLGD